MSCVRLWSIHPKYLDPQGLVALWRESLLARAVLRGQTIGYRNHPQLQRFRAHAAPRSAISTYLAGIYAEATARGYAFDRSKLGPLRPVNPIAVTAGQISHEWQHLMRKLATRNPALHEYWRGTVKPDCHPLLRIRPGAVEEWERPQIDRRERHG